MKSITGYSANAERNIQDRMTTAISKRFERQYRLEIAKTMMLYAENVSDSTKFAQINAEHKAALERILRSNWGVASDKFGMRIINAVRKSYSKIMRKDFFQADDQIAATPIYDAARIAWASQYAAKKVTEIAGTTADNAAAIIKSAVSESIEQGLSEVNAAKLIREKMLEDGVTISKYRSRVIARTETSMAAQSAQNDAAKAIQLPMKKVWSSDKTARARKTHLAADGQRVGLNDYFIVGGEKLLHPCDPNGSAENVINCRCVELFELDL